MDEYQIRKQQRQARHEIAVEARKQRMHVNLVIKAAVTCFGSYVLLDKLVNISDRPMERRQQALEQLAGPHGKTIMRMLAIQAGVDLSRYQDGWSSHNKPVR